jgi:hypothetical protein
MRIVCREGKNVRSLSCFNGSNGWNGHLWKNVAEMAKGLRRVLARGSGWDFKYKTEMEVI